MGDKKYRMQAYRVEWETEAWAKSWLRESRTKPGRAYCVGCEKDLLCGKSELVKHSKTTKHLMAMGQCNPAVLTAKANREKAKTVLIDSIVTLCKEMLVYKEEMRLDGLIGITLDHQETLFVTIKEVLNEKTGRMSTIKRDGEQGPKKKKWKKVEERQPAGGADQGAAKTEGDTSMETEGEETYLTPERAKELTGGKLDLAMPAADQAKASSETVNFVNENGMAGHHHGKDKAKRQCMQNKYTYEQKTVIGRYAVEHGIASAVRKFRDEFDRPLQESSVRNMKKLYLEARKHSGDEELERLVPPKKARGHFPLLGEYDAELVEHVKAVRLNGEQITHQMVMDAARGILLQRNSSLLKEHGGTISITKKWADRFIKRINKLVSDGESVPGTASMHANELHMQDPHSAAVMILQPQHQLQMIDSSYQTMVGSGEDAVPEVAEQDRIIITLPTADELSAATHMGTIATQRAALASSANTTASYTPVNVSNAGTTATISGTTLQQVLHAAQQT